MQQVTRDFIEELRIQSSRDLEQAERILHQDGHMEHVAWFCEQGYEKLAKHGYAYFKAEFDEMEADKIHSIFMKKRHYAPSVVLDMATELMQAFWIVWKAKPQDLSAYPEELRPYISSLIEKVPQDAMNRINTLSSSIGEKIRRILKERNFTDFIKNCSDSALTADLARFHLEPTVEKTVDDSVGEMRSILPAMNLAGVLPFVMPKLYTDYSMFIVRLLALAPWVLPHVEASRYPVQEYGYSNLKMYRELEPQLQPFFGYLIGEINSLERAVEGFKAAINEFTKIKAAKMYDK